jgi:membrane fusion protein (multidrug efflux system)
MAPFALRGAAEATEDTPSMAEEREAHDEATAQAGAETSAPEDAPEGADTPAAGRKRARMRKVLLVVGSLAVIAFVAWFAHHELVGKYLQETDDAYVQAEAVSVAPKVAGYVDAVLVGENQQVRAGQPLVRIDPRDYRAQAAQSQAQIQVAKATADAIRAQIAEQQAGVAEARAQLAAAQAQAEFAASEVRRYTPLVQIGAEPAEQLAAKRNDAKQAADQVVRQRAALASAERRVGSMQAQVRQAEAQGAAAAAQLAAANVNVEATTINASIAGRIGDQTVRVGQFVQPGMRMMSVVPQTGLYIDANFKETQIGGIHPGLPAKVHVDALSGLELKGHVESLSPGTGAQFSLLPPQNATGNFIKIVQRVPVRIALDVSPEIRARLVPGLSAKVEVDTRGTKR